MRRAVMTSWEGPGSMTSQPELPFVTPWAPELFDVAIAPAAEFYETLDAAYRDARGSL